MIKDLDKLLKKYSNNVKDEFIKSDNQKAKVIYDDVEYYSEQEICESYGYGTFSDKKRIELINQLNSNKNNIEFGYQIAQTKLDYLYRFIGWVKDSLATVEREKKHGTSQIY